MIVAAPSQKSTPLPSDEYLDTMHMHYGDESLVQADIKPAVESTDMAVQQRTQSKLLLISPSKTLPSTSTCIKSEVCTAETVTVGLICVI